VASNKKDTPDTDKRNWYSDRYEFVSVQRNFLAVITLLALVLAVTATFSISQLAPLKSVEPFVIQVDQKSGMTQVVEQVKARDIAASESVNQYFIVQYCRARESYMNSDRNYYNYNLVRVLSERPIFSQYQREVSLSDPESPGMRLGQTGVREIHIESIKYLDKHKATTGEDILRYLVKAKITEKNGGLVAKEMQKIILIEFKYVELELTTEDRYLNPIGFQVVSYSVGEDNYTQ